MNNKREKATVSQSDNITKFTYLQIEVAMMKAQGHTYTQIADSLGKKYGKPFAPSNLSRGFENFIKSAPLLREAYLELQNAHFYEYLFDRKEYGRKMRARQLELQKQQLLNGIWPFGRGSGRPWGTVLDENGKMILPPEKQEVIKRIFRKVAEGASASQVAREEGINESTMRNILKNPYYIGLHDWRDEILKGSHESIIDKDTWEAVQKTLTIKKPSVPHFGFHRTAAGTATSPESLELLRKICELRAKKTSYPEIASTLKIKSSTAWEVVHDPFYRDIIGADLWERARNTKTPFGSAYLRARAQRIKHESQTKILLYLQRSGPSRIIDIVKALELSDSAVYTNLCELKNRKNPMVNKDPESKKWFLTDKP